MNTYFVDNPEKMLGDMQMVSGPHGMESGCIAYQSTKCHTPNKMSYAAPETPLPLSTQQKGLSPEGFIPGNCVHEVFGGIHKAQLVAARLPAWR